jgi:hypothetical protein
LAKASSFSERYSELIVTGLVWVAEAILLGCLLINRFVGLSAVRPAWARWLLIFGAGAALGIGLTSVLFFLFSTLLGMWAAALGLEVAALAWAGYEPFRRRAPAPQPANEKRAPLLASIAAIGLLLALAMATGAIAMSWDANPQGDWDAWAIWNLRARFLVSGGALAQRAWSPILGASTHAEYPLLLSSFVARCWAFSHSFSTVVPAATSYVFFLALIALVAGGMAALRGPALGLLAALVLASTPALLHQVPNQYADVPLACYFAGAIVFALLDRPILAGVLAGCAAWTKDEGVLFLFAFLAVTAAWKRRTALATLAGAAPAGALVIIFKTWLARGNAGLLSTSLPGAGKRLADAGRYGATMAAFGREFAHMGVGWYHPILPVIALAMVLRFDRERRRDAAYCGALVGFLLIGNFGVYIVTNNDLAWQLQTSLNRVLLQIWPALVVAAFVGLREPKAAVVVKPVMAAAKLRRKARA